MPKHLDIDGYLDSLADPVRALGDELRTLLDDALPGATGVVWHGHPVWMDGKVPLAGFNAYSAYVTFMIWNANQIADPTGRLQFGKHMATVKVRAASEIDPEMFRSWLRAATTPGAT